MPGYASLRTAGTPKEPEGSSWTAGRFLYLRMRYAWGLWCIQQNKNKIAFIENFLELKEIAGFEKTPAKKAASLLHAHLQRVCALASIPFTAQVVKVESTAKRQADGTQEDAYEVLLTKKPDQLKAERQEAQQRDLKQQQLQFQQGLATTPRSRREAKGPAPGEAAERRRQGPRDTLTDYLLGDRVRYSLVTLSAAAFEAAFWCFKKLKVKQQRQRA